MELTPEEEQAELAAIDRYGWVARPFFPAPAKKPSLDPAWERRFERDDRETQAALLAAHWPPDVAERLLRAARRSRRRYAARTAVRRLLAVLGHERDDTRGAFRVKGDLR